MLVAHLDERSWTLKARAIFCSCQTQRGLVGFLLSGAVVRNGKICCKGMLYRITISFSPFNSGSVKTLLPLMLGRSRFLNPSSPL